MTFTAGTEFVHSQTWHFSNYGLSIITYWVSLVTHFPVPRFWTAPFGTSFMQGIWFPCDQQQTCLGSCRGAASPVTVSLTILLGPNWTDNGLMILSVVPEWWRSACHWTCPRRSARPATFCRCSPLPAGRSCSAAEPSGWRCSSPFFERHALVLQRYQTRNGSQADCVTKTSCKWNTTRSRSLGCRPTITFRATCT